MNSEMSTIQPKTPEIFNKTYPKIRIRIPREVVRLSGNFVKCCFFRQRKFLEIVIRIFHRIGRGQEPFQFFSETFPGNFHAICPRFQSSRLRHQPPSGARNFLKPLIYLRVFGCLPFSQKNREIFLDSQMKLQFSRKSLRKL